MKKLILLAVLLTLTLISCNLNEPQEYEVNVHSVIVGKQFNMNRNQYFNGSYLIFYQKIGNKGIRQHHIDDYNLYKNLNVGDTVNVKENMSNGLYEENF